MLASSPPAAATAPRPGLGPPKLRSSCDSCGTAKVKCDRGRPECSRCATLGLGCVYGLSRKFGKPPRKRPGAYLKATREKRICTQEPIERCNSHTTLGFMEPRDVNESARAGLPDLVVDNLPFSCGVNIALGIAEQDEPSSDFYPSLSFEEWPQLSSFGASLEIPTAPALAPVSTTSASSGTHNCPRESYEIFRDLICPTPSLHAPESNSLTVSAQLDEVLYFNRNAIDRLSQLLKCPCAKSGHRAMVHASIISRILIWYQQAAGWTGSSSWGPRPSALADSSTCCRVSSSSPSSPLPPSPSGTAGTSTASPPSLAQATGFIVEHVPVSMGTFSIEDQDLQATFRNQLVLSELKKTANLIDMFTSQGLGESSASGMAGLYTHLGAWLRSEHSRTVRILRSGLGVLNEGLES